MCKVVDGVMHARTCHDVHGRIKDAVVGDCMLKDPASTPGLILKCNETVRHLSQQAS